MKNKKILVLLASIIIMLDQVTKILLKGKNISIIPNFLDFTYTENQGIAFGIGANNSIVIILINIIIISIIIKFLKKRSNQTSNSIIFALVLILAGGISNLSDRLLRGYVIDFIDINLLNFPNFNIADITITFGTIFLIIILSKSLLMSEKVKVGEKNEI